MKKSSGGVTNKSGAKPPKPSNASFRGKKSSSSNIGSKPASTPVSSSSGNSYAPPSYSSAAKSGKSAFGIIWLPTRKNKKKDMVYNAHKRYEDRRDRSPSMYNFMSETPGYHPYKKKDEDTDLLVPENARAPIATVTGAGVAVAAAEVQTDNNDVPKPEEKKDLLKNELIDDKKDESGDTKEHDDKKEHNDKNKSDYLENKETVAEKNSDTCKWDNEKQSDKVDSVYLRPPPPHKVRSNASSNDEEDCGIKCLYYTLQCCDCVIM